jgi:hypothetical protein
MLFISVVSRREKVFLSQLILFAANQRNEKVASTNSASAESRLAFARRVVATRCRRCLQHKLGDKL